MPLHLESITSKEGYDSLSWILQNQFNDCEDIYATKNKIYLHISKNIIDIFSGEKIGEYIFTTKIDSEKKTNEILDIDIVFKNPTDTKITFIEKLSPSSEANEYYNAATENGGHFQIETVNRYLIEENIEGEKYSINLSAFPFKLSLYDDIEAFNEEMGFSKNVRVGGTDLTVSGYSESFIAPSDLFKDDIDSDATFSFVIGKITKLQKSCIEMNGEPCEIILAQLNTAVGNLTTVINPDRYEVESIRVGKIIAMKADIKANFKLTDKYQKREIVEKRKKTFWDKVKKIFK